MKHLNHYETIIRNLFETESTLNFGRPVQVPLDRKAQANDPYISLNLITWVEVGIVQREYENVDQDLTEKLKQQVDITFSLLFQGGNAKGELSLCLLALSKKFEIQKFLYDENIAFVGASNLRDITGVVGGQLEEAAQADITFNTFFITDSEVIPYVERVEITGKADNINIKPIIEED